MSKALFSFAWHVYAVACVLYLVHLVRPRAGLALGAFLTLLVGLGLHTAVLGLRLQSFGYLPAKDLVEGLAFFSWVLVLGFIILERRYRLPIIGAFVMPVVLVLVMPALLAGPRSEVVPEALKLEGLRLHILIAFVGIAACALATGVAAMFLLLERDMKHKRFGMFFSRLPSLDKLDAINHTLVRWGFVALTVTLVSGAFFAKQAWGDYWHWDPKQVVTLLAWGIYATLVQARLLAGWRGRRVAVLTMLGFAILFCSFVGLRALPGSMHAGEFQ